MGSRHATRAQVYEDVIARMFDITNMGTELKGQYATDSNDREIFSTSNPNDVNVLTKIASHPAGLNALIIR